MTANELTPDLAAFIRSAIAGISAALLRSITKYAHRRATPNRVRDKLRLTSFLLKIAHLDSPAQISPHQ